MIMGMIFSIFFILLFLMASTASSVQEIWEKAINIIMTLKYSFSLYMIDVATILDDVMFFFCWKNIYGAELSALSYLSSPFSCLLDVLFLFPYG